MYKKMDLINEESIRWMGNDEREMEVCNDDEAHFLRLAEFDNSEKERTRTMDIISLKIGGRITD